MIVEHIVKQVVHLQAFISIPGYFGNTPYDCVPYALPVERKAVAVRINTASADNTDKL